jgi:hypothetical protein
VKVVVMTIIMIALVEVVTHVRMIGTNPYHAHRCYHLSRRRHLHYYHRFLSLIFLSYNRYKRI